MIQISNETFFEQLIPSYVPLLGIQRLRIKFPINDQFWSIVPNLKQLYSLNLSLYTDTCQSQLQSLLDCATHLYRLAISQDTSLPLQMSLIKCTNASVNQLDLQYDNPRFSEDECIILSVPCQVLSIQVKSHESFIYLVKNMINLRVLYAQCEDEKNSEHSSQPVNDKKTENNDDLVQWLKDRLLSTCVIVKDSHFVSRIRIWM